MTLNTVVLRWDLTDLIQAGISATLSITPTAQMSDTADHVLIPVKARTYKFTGGTGQLAGIVANDNAAIMPAYNPPSQPGAGYLVSVTDENGQVIVPQFQTQILFANGATQWLDALVIVPSVSTTYQYLPLPSGTPTAGYVPVATGSGEASAWGPQSGGGGAVSSVFTRTGAVTAQSGDYSVGQVTGAAPLASPALTGSPTAPTQTTGDASTKIATDAFVATAAANATAGATVMVPKPTGLTATDTPNVTAAITALTTALASGPATLLFQDGTYQVDSNSAVIRSVSNFAVRSAGRTVLQQAPNRVALPNNVTGDIFVIADCTDFRVEGLTFDGNRDTVAPITPLTASASSGQPSVTVAAGQGSRYLAGQFLYLFGGLGTGEQNQAEGFGVGSGTPLTILSITPGGGAGGGDLITFTTNLANTYTQVSGTLVSDAWGPYACNGAYLTPYQCGTANSVAGRTLSGEDQQNGLHLLNCQRFTVSRCTARNTWESPFKLGTGEEGLTSLGDACLQGDVTDCIAYHGYDQGISVWLSQNITVKGCVANSAGWAGISLTASDHCTVTGNQLLNSIYRVPGDVSEGNGLAIEGGQHNQVHGNVITSPNGDGMRILLSPLWFGLSSVTYPTLGAFWKQDSAAGTSLQVSTSANLQVNGRYSVIDGAQTEEITVASIVDGTHVTLTAALRFSHATGCFIGRRIAAENTIQGNTITSPATGSGIRLFPAVRNVIKNNSVTRWTSAGNGIGMVSSNASMPTYLGGDGSNIEGNVIIGGGGGSCIQVQGASNLMIRGNQLGDPGGTASAMVLEGISDSTVQGNRVSDVVNGGGIQMVANTTPALSTARVTLNGNVIRRTHTSGLLITVADSLTITGNDVQSCGGTAGIDLQGVTRSVVSGNVANSNAGTGILLEDSGGGAHCLYNTVRGNIARDDGSGLNIFSSLAGWTQAYGIRETGGSDYNTFTGNECDSNGTGQLVTAGAHSVAFANTISGAIANAVAVLDATATDIQPLGTQAAGATGLAADAGHVHPLPAGWYPADTGYLEWNYDPGPSVGAATALATAGVIFLIRVNLRVARTVTNVIAYYGTAGNTLTTGQCFAGLYSSSGTLIGTTADQAAAWVGSTGIQTLALTGGPFSVPAGFCWVALLFNGTTGPGFGRTNSFNGTIANTGLGAASKRWGSILTGQTSLPASITPASIGSQQVAYWAALS